MSVKALLLLASVGAGLLAACSSSTGGSDPATFNDYRGYNAEYFREAHSLHLPPTYGWPTHAPGPNDSDHSFQTGSGATDADAYWFCAWERNWMTHLSQPDSAIAQRDLAMLRRIKTLHLYTVATPPGERHIVTDMIERAALGDSSLIARDVRVNCITPVRSKAKR